MANTNGLRITRKVGRVTYAIAENLYGNWYGYRGNKRVQMFFGNCFSQEFDAKEWLQAQTETTAKGDK